VRALVLLAVVCCARPATVAGQLTARDSIARRDSLRRLDSLAALPRGQSGLDIRFNTGLEAKLERNRNDRCSPGQSFLALASCRSGFQPQFDFRVDLLTNGTVADRVHVNVDYDSQREFDVSNNISIYYEGKPNSVLRRLDVGNVSFAPPPSRFITSGIPSGNYGVQAEGHIGAMTFRGIIAQQKGNVVQTRAFTVGDRTLRPSDNTLADYQFEARRFFWTIDPALLPGYPNIDILDAQRLAQAAASLADTLRPTHISLYRLLIGAPPPNPNGPRFIPRGARNESRGQAYEYLREGIDYYVDPSRLWIALVRPLRLNDERLVVAYNVALADGRTVYPPTGGTPDLEATPQDQFANLLWDPEVAPSDAVFNREIRSVYRIGGDEVLRASIRLRVSTGEAGDREKPQAGASDTYLQLFGLAQAGNSSEFDAENRIWPRTTDPAFDLGGAAGQRLLSDAYVVFPSATPFSVLGLAGGGNPSNDPLYVARAEDLTSSRRPQVVYRMLTSFSSTGEGGGDAGTIALGSVQIRRNSERIDVDGIPLVRDADYTIDYDLGRVVFLRPDTLFRIPRRVSARYEENPLFGATPTSIFALNTQFPLRHGDVGVTAIRQTQSSTFNRPTLGFEPASSLLAGITSRFTWEVPSLTRLVGRLPFGSPSAPSRITLRGELALSRPDANTSHQAYLESFEGEGGVSVSLGDPSWYYSSQPVASSRLPDVLLDPARAATLAWQSIGVDADNRQVIFHVEDIDPQTRLAGGQFGVPEPLLWLTLYPLGIGGARDATGAFTWTVQGTPSGRRWRSVRTPLGTSGADLSHVETIEFWTLADTNAVRRTRNPMLVLDVGDVSENTLAFAPDTLLVDHGAAAGWRGKRAQGLGTIESERDPFTRTFNAGVNDVGLPGDMGDRVTVLDASSRQRLSDSVSIAICRAQRSVQPLGDSRANCTVGNDRLDEEDIDSDNVLNVLRDAERVRRYVVDLSDRASYDRVGHCLAAGDHRVDAGGRELCWVHVRIPFAAPTEQIGAPSVRRMKGLRVTVVSGTQMPDDAFTQLAIGRLRFVGAPWIKRADQTLTGIAGEFPAGGTVTASLVGTEDSSAVLSYQSPPGVLEEPDAKAAAFGVNQVQVNEHSLRILATAMPLNARAEAYYRFPEGDKSFMGYSQLRLWARGRNAGWGQGGELQVYVKIGRDANNFYLYRAPVRSGLDVLAWDPETQVDFARWQQLRSRIQAAYLQGSAAVTGCTAADSALIAASDGGATPIRRYVACDSGYIAYTIDPDVSAPTLAGVQEMAVGMVRVAQGTGARPIAPGDTLELWVDDVRLSGVVSATGYAGEVGIDVDAGGLMDLRLTAMQRDRNFRQLTEQPGFATEGGLTVASTVHLERLLPASFGLALPLTVTHVSSGSDPVFIAHSDIPAGDIAGLRTPRSAATSWQLTARRATPLAGGAFAPLVNNLSVNSNVSVSDSRSEYQESGARSLAVGAAYDAAGAARTAQLPRWLDRAIGWLPSWLEQWTPVASLRSAQYRVNPSRLRFASTMARSDDDRVSFLKPASAIGDDGRRVAGASRLWRNSGTFELRPTSGFLMRLDLSSLRDLRDYGDTTAGARAAASSRSALFGSDIGLERERGMQTALLFSPTVAAWIRPTFTLGTQFAMSRDPNQRSLVLALDSTGDAVLPRRLTNSQLAGAGASVDLSRVIGGLIPDSGVRRRFTATFQPVSVNVTRNLVSAFDRASFMAPLSYQLGLGGAGSFREVDGRRATIAGLSNSVVASHVVSLPLGLSVYDRYQRTTSRSWTRRPDGGTGVTDGTQRSFPDVSISWNWRPRAPGSASVSIGSVVTNVSGQAGVRRTVRTTFRPAEQLGFPSDSTRELARSYPANLAIAWGLFGGFTTSATYNVSRREDIRPGSQLDGSTHDMSAEIARSFKPRPQWNLRSDIRTRLTIQDSRTRSVIYAAGATTASRLGDNGRSGFTFTADADVSQDAAFSLVASRIVTFDNNFNRRFTQTVFSAVLHLQFFGGNLR
jgi:cell surface protein SprA